MNKYMKKGAISLIIMERKLESQLRTMRKPVRMTKIENVRQYQELGRRWSKAVRLHCWWELLADNKHFRHHLVKTGWIPSQQFRPEVYTWDMSLWRLTPMMDTFLLGCDEPLPRVLWSLAIWSLLITLHIFASMCMVESHWNILRRQCYSKFPLVEPHTFPKLLRFLGCGRGLCYSSQQ